ncbi:hypothetical protein [Thiothrix fructosivorans]|uniref:Uncharacterized protein n=1 Tax=Thiothrix fructosivorans TaxID=111770 RepID=A0A8B0SR40_9GAMM|nr:hypothetical protein [Thiothrix fructosivorans]QTX13090.1 hypothetical protein J1836_020305 [Thiothrix fructosivorans]
MSRTAQERMAQAFRF